MIQNSKKVPIMVSKSEINSYIQNERYISKYKISCLERYKDLSHSKKRLLNIEREFLTLPLENLDFEDIADVAAAISIYYSSRNLFYQTYEVSPPELYQIDKPKLVQAISDKLDFIGDTGRTLIRTRVQELNLVQNPDFYYDFAKRQSIKNKTTIDFERRELDSMSLRELLDVEPLTIAKKRARSQAVIFSLGSYFLQGINQLKVESSMSLEELREVSESLDSIIDNIKENIFKNYNVGLGSLPGLLDGTMGENPYISKLHCLQNVMDFTTLKKFGGSPRPISDPKGFQSVSPVIGNIFSGAKKAIAVSPQKDLEKNIQNKVFGILLPIPRKGNERMALLYKNILIDGYNVSHLFSDSISNIKALDGDDEVYYKSVLMLPLWKIINMAYTDDSSRYILSKIINFRQSNFQSINFNDVSVIRKINSLQSSFLEVSKESIVLTAKTRSEEEGLSDIFSIINSRVSEIKDDYLKIAGTTNEIFLD